MSELYIDDGYTEGDNLVNGGIYVNWLQRDIYVPRQFGALVQTVPTEVRRIDINTFRLKLRELEASGEGVLFQPTHNHNTTTVVGAVTLARVVEIINNYTITFEDGEYTVQLVGANSNIADVVNRNRVSVASDNSAGLITISTGPGGDCDLTPIQIALAVINAGVQKSSILVPHTEDLP